MPWAVEAAVNVGWLFRSELNFALTVVDGTVFGVHAVVVLQFVVLPFQTDVVVSATIADWLNRNVASVTAARPRAINRNKIEQRRVQFMYQRRSEEHTSELQ